MPVPAVPAPSAGTGRVRMADVAALAGVSVKTVSRVLSDVTTVDPALVVRTRDAAARLGYRVNATASSLRRGDRRSATIGLLLDDVGNPFSAAIHRAVENVANAHGCLVLTGSLDQDPDRERDLVHALLARQVDGLIIVPAGNDHSYLTRDQDAGAQFVFLDRPPVHLRADTVVSTNAAGSRAAVRHLLARGHRRIAYLGDRSALYTARTRFTGYRAALTTAGVQLDDRLIRHDLCTVDAAAAAVTDLLTQQDPPTALFTSQNLITAGATRALRSLDRHHTTGLIGFDDFPLAADLDPPITVIAQNIPFLGARAAELLFDHLAGQPAGAAAHRIPTRLIPRGSGEIPAPTTAAHRPRLRTRG